MIDMDALLQGKAYYIRIVVPFKNDLPGLTFINSYHYGGSK